MTEQKQVRLSRELDLKVARLVMGYAHFRFTRDDGTTFVQLMTRDDANTYYIRGMNPVEVEYGDEENAPRYSTDIALAFQVVEKMREKGFILSLDQIDCRENGFWAAHFMSLRVVDIQARMEGQGPARAICLAAIEAVQAGDAR